MVSQTSPLLVSRVTTRDGCTRHGIGAGLLLLEVCLIVQGLLLVWCHGVLVGGHASSTRLHAGCGGRDVGVCVLGRFDGRFTIDAVRVGRLGGIEACLIVILVRAATDCVFLEWSYLDQVLALGLGHQRLELGSGEGVDETSLGHDEQKDLGASEDRQFVGLARTVSVKGAIVAKAERHVASRVVQDEQRHTFFMMPAFLLEKVM